MKDYLFYSFLISSIAFVSMITIPLFDTSKPKYAPPTSIAPAQAKTYVPRNAYERKLLELADWNRPDGPIKIALQSGHWKANEAPAEFPNLSKNTGTQGGGWYEWELNLDIAQRTKELIQTKHPDWIVEILPATIPPDYYADIFIAIHADGNENPYLSGYKGSTSWRDLSGKAHDLLQAVETEYEKVTGLPYDPNITRNMRGYYAFNWRRYKHSLHPMTPAIIMETGFLTSPADREVIAKTPERPAQGIANGIFTYFENQAI